MSDDDQITSKNIIIVYLPAPINGHRVGFTDQLVKWLVD